MKDLMSRVGEDIKQLKSDVSSLLTHTGRHTLPDSARDLRDSARNSINAGGDYAASQIRYIRQHPGQSSAGILGGLILLGAVGAGIYYICNSDCCSMSGDADEEMED